MWYDKKMLTGHDLDEARKFSKFCNSFIDWEGRKIDYNLVYLWAKHMCETAPSSEELTPAGKDVIYALCDLLNSADNALCEMKYGESEMKLPVGNEIKRE